MIMDTYNPPKVDMYLVIRALLIEAAPDLEIDKWERSVRLHQELMKGTT